MHRPFNTFIPGKIKCWEWKGLHGTFFLVPLTALFNNSTSCQSRNRGANASHNGRSTQASHHKRVINGVFSPGTKQTNSASPCTIITYGSVLSIHVSHVTWPPSLVGRYWNRPLSTQASPGPVSSTALLKMSALSCIKVYDYDNQINSTCAEERIMSLVHIQLRSWHLDHRCRININHIESARASCKSRARMIFKLW